jgi:tetratricopeptide (TPR) repeat protein
LFYQVLLGEMELQRGELGNAYEILLDAARRSREGLLFKRAVEIAVQGRAGDQALTAAKAWRLAQPTQAEAARTELQLQAALGRVQDAGDALRALIALTPRDERAGLLTSLPRVLVRGGQAEVGMRLLQGVLAPLASDPLLGVPAQVALARGHLAVQQPAAALALARDAHRRAPQHAAVALLAVELLPTAPEAESLVREQLSHPEADLGARLAYARALIDAQRLADANVQLRHINRQQPEMAQPYLMLGALELELRHFAESREALLRYLALTQPAVPAAAGLPLAPSAAPGATAAASPEDTDTDDESASESPAQGRTEAWLMLARGAEQQGDAAAAEGWLARIEGPDRRLDVATRRAALLARQGRLEEARQLLRNVPELKPTDARTKLLAEAALLRDNQRYADAHGLLVQANQNHPRDPDLLYEQAMLAEKLDRMDEMESLLRRVIEIDPQRAHAYNALGYSLADRGQRLPEARQLVQRALALSPGDPFITDSLGWIEFRLGNLPEAIRLLRLAHDSRPDAEIAAHLGEALWAAGQRDEALVVWRGALARDASNEALRETLQRLKVKP